MRMADCAMLGPDVVLDPNTGAEPVHSPTNAYAVIIGVADYSACRGRPSDNLPGSDKDALDWLRVAMAPESLGIPRENIRLLAVDARGRKVKGADGRPTAKRIRKAIAWLARKLAAAADPVHHDAFGPTIRASGLVTFSGHGFSLEGLSDVPLGNTLFLAPSDLEASADGPRGALSLGELNASSPTWARTTGPWSA
ncbi:MAG: hypothetical protein ACI8PZ_005937 [Myxococcota bacterium]|jgi:hypothetical protein